MAKDDSQQGNPGTSRVYKSSGVHKRRVDRKGRPKGNASASQPIASDSAEAPDSQGVVLKPDFNRRTEAQKAADDRWFAAMREGAFREGPRSSASAGQGVGDPPSASTGPQGAPQASPQGAPQASPQASPQGIAQGSPTAPMPAVSPEAGKADGAELGRESEDSAAPPAADEPARGAISPRSPGKPGHRKRTALIVAGVVVLLVVVAGALFAWNRWWRFDDHADMQGQWYVVGTAVPVTIDESSIHLTDDVVYTYALNPQDKTIGYAFGPMGGQGRYWFSDDRQYLVITDGDSFTAAGTAVDDLLHAFKDLPDKATGNDLQLPEGEGIIAFSREPDAEAVAKQEAEAAEKAAAEKAAADEAARVAAEQAAADAAEAAAAEEEYYDNDDSDDGSEEYTEESEGDGDGDGDGDGGEGNEGRGDE